MSHDICIFLISLAFSTLSLACLSSDSVMVFDEFIDIVYLEPHNGSWLLCPLSWTRDAHARQSATFRQLVDERQADFEHAFHVFGIEQFSCRFGNHLFKAFNQSVDRAGFLPISCPVPVQKYHFNHFNFAHHPPAWRLGFQARQKVLLSKSPMP